MKEPRIELTFSVITPFLAYWPPEHLGGSGVLATVTAGLYISWNGLRLISAATRLQGIFFWDFFIYLLEGMIFLVTGLQARTFIHQTKTSRSRAVRSGRWSSAPSLLCRASSGCSRRYMSLAGFHRICAKRDPSPPWQWASMLSFTGVRGIVSLAAALAIPLTTASGAPFPNRDYPLLTFAVILVTLVGQGSADFRQWPAHSALRRRGTANAMKTQRKNNRAPAGNRRRDCASGRAPGRARTLGRVVAPLRCTIGPVAAG